MKTPLVVCPLAVFALGTLPAQATPTADPFAILAALPALPPVERGVRVVVRDAKGAPVPGAMLVVVATGPRHSAASTEAAKEWPGDAVQQGALACATAGGERYALDERGTAAVPRASGFALAWHDGTFASRRFMVAEGQPSPRIELALAAPWSARIEVVDAKGAAAAGVPVGLAGGNAAGPRHTTDAGGKVTLRTFASHVTPTSVVRLLIAAAGWIEAPAQPSTDAIRLQLPECGRVQAKYDGPLLPGSTPSWSLQASDRRIQPTAAGPRDATFAFVQAGYEGELQVTADAATIQVPVRGVTAGTTLELAAARKDGGRYVVLRPLAPDGKPVPKGYCTTRWHYPNGSSSSGATTNAEGWLELEVPGNPGDVKLQLAVHAGTWTSPLLGTLELEVATAETGRIDKGERKTTVADVALAGHVVSTVGKPLRGIQFYATGELNASTVTDAEGKFQIGLAGGKPDAVTLRLSGDGWFFAEPPGLQCEFPTAEPARIVLQAAGRVRFAAPGLPEGVGHDFSLRLEPADGGGGDPLDMHFTVGREFLFLPAGHWHFVLMRNGQELHRLPDLRVDAGVETHDPRFMAFDWRAFASLLVVHVEDADGKPTSACTVWLRSGGGGRGSAPTNGVARWLVVDDGTSVHIDPRDDKLPDLNLGPARGELWVRLGAGPRLEVRVDTAVKLPANAQLLARIGGRAEPLVLDAAGTGFAWLDHGGNREVQLVLRVGEAMHDLPDAKKTVDVLPGGAVLAFPGSSTQVAIDRVAR